jgi:hypothetical protein
MNNMIAQIILISLFCNGWYLITRQGMIFFFLHRWYVEASKGFFRADGEVEWMYRTAPALPRFIYKPLFGCLPCMASIWGSTGYVMLNGFNDFVNYIFTIVCVACLNLIIKNIYE